MAKNLSCFDGLQLNKGTDIIYAQTAFNRNNEEAMRTCCPGDEYRWDGCWSWCSIGLLNNNDLKNSTVTDEIKNKHETCMRRELTRITGNSTTQVPVVNLWIQRTSSAPTVAPEMGVKGVALLGLVVMTLILS